MKVFVAGEYMCGEHQIEPDAEQELVMIATCVECDPNQTMFVGLESGEPYKYAVVAERAEIDRKSYVAIIRNGIDSFLHFDNASREQIRAKAERDAQWMRSVAAQYKPGTPISRHGETLTAHPATKPPRLRLVRAT